MVVMSVAIVVVVKEGWKHVLQEASIVLRHEVLHPERSASCRRSGGSSSTGSQVMLVVRQRVLAGNGGVHLLKPGGDCGGARAGH